MQLLVACLRAGFDTRQDRNVGAVTLLSDLAERSNVDEAGAKHAGEMLTYSFRVRAT